MKKILYTICAMAMFFTSCSKEKTIEQGNGNDNGAVEFTAFQPATTRVIDGSWKVGDGVGIFVKGPGADNLTETNIEYKLTNIYGAMSAVSDVIYLPVSGPQSYYAYYPYKEGVTETKYAVDLTEQRVTDIRTLALLWAKTETVSGASVPLQFDHQLVKLNIALTAGGLNVKSLEGATVTLLGANTKGDFDLITGKHAISTKQVDETPLKVSVSEDNKTATVTALVLPMESLNKSVSIKVVLEDEIFITPITPINTETWEKGKKYDYNITVGIEPYKIGDPYPDATDPIGMVWKMNEDDLTGSIISLDEPVEDWGGEFNVNPERRLMWGPRSTVTSAVSETDGLLNMATVWKLQNNYTYYPAFRWVHEKNVAPVTSYETGQKGVWYLPAKDQLEALQRERATLNPALRELVNPGTTFGGFNYWSSTEHPENDGADGWYVDFASGGMNGSTKNFARYVRAMMDF